nr:uncharacterized protein LOC132593426 isoform X2 [Globicephala melas]
MFPLFATLRPLRGYQAEADKPSCLLVTRHTAQAFRAASISEGLAGCRDRDTRAPGQPVKQGGHAGRTRGPWVSMTGGRGRHPLGLCTARRAPSGPFSSRPGPWRGPPLGCLPAPRPPFVQWVHTALLCPGVWPGGSLISRARAERAWGHLYRAPLPPGLQTSVQSPRCCLPTWHACAHTGTRAHMSRLSHSPAQGGLQPQGHCPCTPDGTTPHGPGLGPVGGVCLGGLPNIWQKPLRDGSPALPRFLEAGDGRKKRRCPSPLTGSCLGLLHVHLTNQPEGVLCMSGRAPPTLVLPSASCGAVPAALPTQRTPWAGAPLSSGCVCPAQGDESDRNACSGLSCCPPPLAPPSPNTLLLGLLPWLVWLLTSQGLKPASPGQSLLALMASVLRCP